RRPRQAAAGRAPVLLPRAQGRGAGGVELDGRRAPVAVPPGVETPPARTPARAAAAAAAGTADRKGRARRTAVHVPLLALAHGRSGDKGDDCNIAIIARHP